MISCIEWIPKNVANPNPKKYELSKAERDLLADDVEESNGTVDDDDDSDEEIDDSASPQKDGEGLTAAEIIASNKIDPSSLPAELRMDDYSDDEEDDGNVQSKSGLGELLIGNDDVGMIGIDEDGQVEDIDVDDDSDDEIDDDDDDNLLDIPDTREYIPNDVRGLEAMNFGGLNGMTDMEDDDKDDDSDIEDTNLQPNDALIIVAKTEEDFATLEICVYEELSGNLFVHHDIPLPSFPLCMAHGTINSDGGAGNYVAVGTFDTGIEIWNADVLNVLEPSVILGGEDTSSADANWAKKLGVKNIPKSKVRNKNGSGLRNGSHTDAVMSLSWNQIHRQVIASGSADNTVKIWDVTKADDSNGGNAATFAIHNDKVQSTAWHTTEGSILATGSYDQTVSILDARSPNGNCKKVKIPADCEAIAWDPYQPHLLTAATEDGSVHCWDIRKFESGSTYWNFVAHEFGGCSDISYNSKIPGMLATCAIDKTVAIWDTQNPGNNPEGKPFACGSKGMEVGKLYSLSFYPSSAWLLGCGGGGNQLALWDISREKPFQKRFGERTGVSTAPVSNNINETEGNEVNEDFEAILAASDKAVVEAKEKVSTGTKKKKKNRSKKKVNRR